MTEARQLAKMPEETGRGKVLATANSLDRFQMSEARQLAKITRTMLGANLARFPSDMRPAVTRLVFGTDWTDDNAPFWKDETAKQQARSVLEELASRLSLEDRQRAGEELRAATSTIMAERLDGSLLRHMERKVYDETPIAEDVSLDVG